MPELPEVECVRRGLVRAKLADKAVVSVWRSKLPLRTGTFWRQEGLSDLRGARTGAFDRRGKFLLWHMVAADNAAIAAVIHLGMTGRITVHGANTDPLPHTHIIVALDGDLALHYSDPRRFGGIHVDAMVRLEREGPVAELGPEPLDRGFSGTVLADAARGSTRAIRDVLLDQRVVAGLGNIYVSEALFVAGIHPLVRANELHMSAWDRIADATRTVLRQGIRNGGTTLRDYRGTRGEPGRNQQALLVYGRADEACTVCGATVVKYVHGGRSGYMCRRCQPARRRR